MHVSKAFTVIELIFVIVIIGILSAVALPKFAGIKTQADTVNAKAQLATIRSAIINERQKRLILGDSSYITAANLDSGGLFGGVLVMPLTDSNTDGHWHATGTAGQYTYKLDGVAVTFDYNATTGALSCDSTNGTYGTQCGNIID